MVATLAALSLLKKLIAKELKSFSSVGLNNFLFCILFLMSGSGAVGRPRDAFWSTLFLQLVLLAPLLVMFSVEAQSRFPTQRLATWPLTGGQRLVVSIVSFVANPLLLVLFLGYLGWMGAAVALFFLLLSMAVHVTVYVVLRLVPGGIGQFAVPAFGLSMKGDGIALETWRELTTTLDFWTALLIALSGTLYRVLGKSPEAEAFPILALFAGIAMSTVAQRMLSLDEGRALLRYRLLPVKGWKLLLMQDAAFLLTLVLMTSLLSVRAGLAFGLMVLAVGRYPSLRQQVSQRRWRFVGGDVRFGAAQVILGGLAGIGAARNGAWVVLIAVAAYVGSLIWGAMTWRRLNGEKAKPAIG